MARREYTIDDKITQAEEAVIKAKAKYDEAVTALQELLEKKTAIQNEELLRLFANSSRSYEEVTAFLKEGMTEEQVARGTKKKPGQKPKTGI